MSTIRQPYQPDQAAATVVDEIRERVRCVNTAPVLVGISGIDCAGKSTFADAVLHELGKAVTEVRLVHVDDFIIPSKDRKVAGTAHVDYFENTFNFDSFVKKLKSEAEATGLQVVVGEGVFLFRKEIVDIWDLRIWLEMSPERSIERGATRDADFFGGLDIASTQYSTRFMPAYKYHIERDQPAESADYVFEVD